MHLKRQKWIAFCLIFCLTGFVPVFPAEQKHPYAEIFFDGIGQNVNIQSNHYEEPSAPLFAKKDKVQVLQMREGGPTYADINVDDSLFPADKPTPVSITVRYFDEGNGYFSLRYPSAKSDFTEPEKVAMTDTQTWKEHTFLLDDIVFNNQANGADFILATWTLKYKGSAKPVYIRSVKVEQAFPNNPITMSVNSAYYGNVFGAADEQALQISFQNITDTPLSGTLSYQVANYSGNPVTDYQDMEFSLASNGVWETTVVTNQTEYGCYFLRLKADYYGQVDGEEKKFSSISDFDFSLVNKREEDEPLNHLTKVCTHYQQDKGDLRNVQMMDDIGVSGFRDEVSWDQAKKANGAFAFPAQMEALNVAVPYGMENMVILANSSSYGGIWNVPTTAEEMKAWLQYVDWVSKNVGDRIKYYEIWNEPNLANFNPKERTPTEYAQLAKQAYPIIKKNDPDSVVCVFSTAQIPISWIEEAIEAGILDNTDAITVHPYDWTGTGMDRRIRNDVYVKRMKELRQLLVKHGKPEMPIIESEIGQSATPSLGSPIAQAAFVTQLFAMTAGEKLADTIFYYDFQNDYLDQPDNQEANWGFIRHWADPVPAAAKPLYAAIAGYNKFLSDAEPVDSIVRNGTSIYRFKRNSDGKQVALIWSDNTSESIGLDFGTNSVELYDMYSNDKGKVTSPNGTYSFTSSFEPQYVVGNFTKLEEAEPTIKTVDGRLYAATNDNATFHFLDQQKRNLTVRTVAEGDLEVVQNDGMKDGIAEVTVHTANDAVKENGVEVAFYDGDALVFRTKVHVCITEPITVSSSIQRYSENSWNRYVAVVSVKNTTLSSTISGIVTADFSTTGDQPEQKLFDRVKPGETINVSFHVPERIVQRTLMGSVQIRLDYGYQKAMDVQLSKNVADYAVQAPSLTGTLDYNEWSGGDWFAADDKYSARYLPGWKGKTDCSLLGTVKWDEDNLYFLGIVEDDLSYQKEEPATMWRGDSIQIALCEASQMAVAESADYVEVGLAKTTQGVVAYRYNTQSMYNMASSNLKSNVVIAAAQVTLEEQNGKYIYRAKIPWAEIFGRDAGVKENDTYGFSVLVNDNDSGTRRGWVEYNSGIGQRKNPALYGPMTLVK